MIRYAVCYTVFEAEETALTRSILAKCEETALRNEADAALEEYRAERTKAVEKKAAAEWQKGQQH